MCPSFCCPAMAEAKLQILAYSWNPIYGIPVRCAGPEESPFVAGDARGTMFPGLNEKHHWYRWEFTSIQFWPIFVPVNIRDLLMSVKAE